MPLHASPRKEWVRTFALLATATLLSGGAVAASDRNVRFERVTLAEGLSQAKIYAVLQDRQGFLWFGTGEGLYRYDGQSFSSFTHESEDPHSLSHDSVRALAEDASGGLWVGTAGGGLNRYLPATETFQRFTPPLRRGERISALKAARDGGLWVGAGVTGLTYLDPEAGVFRNIPYGREDDVPTSLRISDIEEDASGYVWVATDGHGLNVVSPGSDVLTRWHSAVESETLFRDERLNTVFEDSRGSLWVGTSTRGLVEIGPSRLTASVYEHDAEDLQTLSANGVWAIHEDRDGVLWIGTDAGLNEWNPATGVFGRHQHDSSDVFSLDNDRVVSIFQDRSGVLWVGTLRGLNKWNPITAHFRHYKKARRGPLRLGADYVTSFAEGAGGEIWIGSYRGGLNRLNMSSGEFDQFLHDPLDHRTLGDNRPTALLADESGELWIGTFGAGLDHLDPRTGEFTHFRSADGEADSLSWDVVTSLALGPEGHVWVGTHGGGLNRLDPETGSFLRFERSQGEKASLSSNHVMSLLVDRAGDLWVGTEGGGLNHLRRGSSTFTVYRHDATDGLSLSGDTVWAIGEDRRGDLWVGTEGNGLNRWSRADRLAGRVAFRHYTKKDGLRSSTIYGILRDEQESLWLSTNAGLARLDPGTSEFTHYDVSHGLQSNEFNLGAAFRSSDGMMFFGGVNGFNAFYPSEIRGNEHVPPVVLTSFSKFNKPVEFDRPLGDIERIELSYKDSVISFEFAALDFTAPHKNKYRYKLEGFDEEWVEAGTRRRATYTNLAAGSYVFRVQGSNNDGVWNTEGVSMPLTVGSHPLQSPFAYGAYGLMSLGLVALYSRVQARRREHAAYLRRTNQTLITEVAQRKEKEKALEKERQRAQRYLEVAEVIMLVVDDAGIVRLINPKGCRVLGRPREEVVGQRWVGQFVRSEDRQKAGRSLIDKGGYWEYSVHGRKGEERIVAWHTAVLRDDDGRRTGTLCSGADVTEERRLAEEKESAEVASQAKSQFLANMSHEIRTPLNGVLGMIELLGGSGLDERQRRLAATAGRSARNLMSILNDILDFSKIEAGKLALEWVDFDLRQVVEEVCALFSETAHQKELELIHFVPPDLPTQLIGDPTRLRQVLSNLLGNAIKFTTKGTVVVAVDAVRTEEDWLDLRCEVRDSGVGLEREARERVFESFSQADESTTRKFGGTGLGLAISKQLVELLGGEIGVDSEPGVGSTFWFTVRLARQPETGVSGELERFGPPAPTVLIVEDNPASGELLEEQLYAWGINAKTVADGPAALRELTAASREGRSYDALLVDHFMADMDGLEVAAAARAQTNLSSLPVVLMASTSLPSGERLERAGITSYVVKPIRRRDLHEAMARALGGGEAAEQSRLGEVAGGRRLAAFHALVAEDNLVNQEVVQGMIEALGGRVTLVENGRRALEVFTEGAFDVVLMDCQMPVLDGYGASRAIRRHEASEAGARRVPIIALTAHALGDDREKCLAAGMDGYLAKPAGLRDLARVLAEHLPLVSGEAAVASDETAAAGPPPAADIDREALEKIRALGGGASSSFLEKVLDTYLRTTPDLVDRMRVALSAADATELADAAHTLKSSSASLGAERLAALCRRLEEAGREGSLETAPALFERLEREFSQIKTALSEEYLAKSA